MNVLGEKVDDFCTAPDLAEFDLKSWINFDFSVWSDSSVNTPLSAVLGLDSQSQIINNIITYIESQPFFGVLMKAEKGGIGYSYQG